MKKRCSAPFFSALPSGTVSCQIVNCADPVVGLRCQGANGLDVAAQLVRYHEPWLTKLSDQSFAKPLGRICTSPDLNKDIKYVAVRVDGLTQPMLLAADRDENLVHVPFVVRLGTIAPDVGSKMRDETIDPKPNVFPATMAPRSAKRSSTSAVLKANRVGNDLTRVAKTLQARHAGWMFIRCLLSPSKRQATWQYPAKQYCVHILHVTLPIYLFIRFGNFLTT